MDASSHQPKEVEVGSAGRRAWRRAALHLTPALLLAAVLAALGLVATAAAAVAAGALWTLAVSIRSERALDRRVRQLRDDLDILRESFRVLPAAAIVVDDQGRKLLFNPAAEEMLGVGPTDDPPSEWSALYGTHRSDTVTPFRSEDLPIQRAMRGEAADEPNIYVSNRARAGFWLSAAARPVRGADGSLRGAVLVCHDVTERRGIEAEVRELNADLESRVRERTASLEATLDRLASEVQAKEGIAQALRDSQRLLQDILDHATAVIFIKDLEGRYLLVNREWVRVIGIDRDGTIGRSDADLLHPDAAEAVRRHDVRVVEHGIPLEFEEQVLTTRGWRTFLSLKFPLHAADGSTYGVCGIATDITERKQIEAELQRSEASLSAVIDNSWDGIWSIDRDYNIQTVNRRCRELFLEVFGDRLRQNAALGERAPATRPDEWRQLYDRALAGERVSSEQVFGEGEEARYFLISLNPIREGETITGVTASSRDISELRRLEERARRNQSELTHVLRLGTIGEISSGLAHEINQPLGAIANFAGACIRMIEAGDASLKEIHRGLARISEEAQRAGSVIRSLRDLTRKGDGKPEPIDINTIVERATRLMQPEAHLRGISLRFEPAAGMPPVEADAVQIEQVVLNLLLNAVEAMHGAAVKRLSLHTQAVNGHIEVAVADTGTGLPEGGLQKAFEPFYTTKETGLGMGLAISRRIVEAHGGRLWATANGDGGSTFAFALPLAGRGHADDQEGGSPA